MVVHLSATTSIETVKFLRKKPSFFLTFHLLHETFPIAINYIYCTPGNFDYKNVYLYYESRVGVCSYSRVGAMYTAHRLYFSLQRKLHCAINGKRTPYQKKVIFIVVYWIYKFL